MLRATDRIAAASLVLGGLFVGWRTAAQGQTHYFASVWQAYAASAILVGSGVLLFRRGSQVFRGQRTIWLRLLLYPGALLLLAAVTVRLTRTPVPRNPVSWQPKDAPFDSIAEDDRLRWAVRVARHWLTSNGHADSISELPADWPVPGDIEFALMTRDGARQIVARSHGRRRLCYAYVFEGRASRKEVGDQLPCAFGSQTDTVSFVRPSRSGQLTLASASTPAVSADAWRQYRRDGSKSASAASPAAPSWLVDLQGSARSTPTISGNAVLIGTHGSGSLESFDLATGTLRWRVYLPNWVHQDVVTDGRITMVGFGDNAGALSGAGPAGVSAYENASGRLLWTAFEKHSVMTSPVILGDDAGYVTSAGLVRVRRLRDGAVLRSSFVPGSATMAPPAFRNDTVVVALDVNVVCAVEFAELRRLWCSHLPRVMMLGHSAPLIVGDSVVVTGMARRMGSLDLLERSPLLSRAVALLLRILRVEPEPEITGQQVFFLDLRRGDIVHQGPVFPSRRHFRGHTSGTGTSDSARILINLPVADRLVSYDRRSGAQDWIVDGGGARGPVLISEGRIFRATLDGHLELLNENDGSVQCSIPLPFRFDRAGPALAGRSLVIGSIDGHMLAVPTQRLEGCETPSTSR